MALSPSLLLTFREGLEASLTVTIISAYLRRIGRTDLNKYLLAGAVTAVLLSVGLGWVIYLAYGELEGAVAEFFEGFTALIAASVLTYMIFWMTKNARRLREEIEHRVDEAISKGQLYGLFAVAFVGVVREGIETVLFLTALLTDPSGTALGILMGIGLVLVVVALLLRGSYRLNVRSFFKYSSILLIVFAAGLAGFGAHKLIEGAELSGVNLGALSQQAFNVNPADRANLFHEDGAVGSVLRSLIGYSGNPEWLQVMVYLGYWVFVGAYLLRAYRPARIFHS